MEAPPFIKKASPHVFENGQLPGHKIHPLRVSLSISMLYLIFGLVYIYLSSHIAALNVLSKDQLENVEHYKGSMFIIFTTILFFFTLFILLRRIQGKQIETDMQKNAIVSAGKQAVAGLFASSIAHEMNNVLSVSYYALKKLSENPGLNDEDREYIKKLRTANDQIHDYASRLTEVTGRHLSEGIQRTDMSRAVDSAANLAATHKKLKACSLEMELPESCMASFDQTLVRNTIINLLLNAAEATAGRGQIRVRLLDSPDSIRVEVHDSGPGIQPKRGTPAAESFRNRTGGTGLDLLCIRHCAEVHHGKFDIKPSPLGGACVHMTFPRQI
jgi:two-component system sensor histidine kinase HydH